MRTVAIEARKPVNNSLADNTALTGTEVKQYKRARTLRNLVFKRLVALCGGMVLLTLAVLLWQLVSQVFPLFLNPGISSQHTWEVEDAERVLMVDDLLKGRTAVVQDVQCHTLFKALDDAQQLVNIKRLPGRCVEQVKAVQALEDNYLARLSSNGLLRIEQVSQVNNSLAHRPTMSLSLLTNLPDQERETLTPDAWQLAISSRRVMVSVRLASGWRVFVVDRANPANIARLPVAQADNVLLLPNIGQFAVLHNTQWTFYNSDNQQVSTHQLSDTPHYLAAMPGDRSILLNYADGRIQTWSFINEQGVFIPRVTAQYDERLQVKQAMFSAQSNAAVLLNEANGFSLVNYVTAQVLNQSEGEEGMALASWQGEWLYTVAGNRVRAWQVNNLSAVTTWRTVFETIWYEGYEEAKYVWQTTYASDYQAAKYSVVPLLIGSFKAALLALVIAIPLATLAAVYTAYFAPQALRSWLKPGIEMLEAIPSVVIGFIAAVWLAPLAEQFLLSMMLFVLLLPLLLLIYSAFQRRMVALLPEPLRRGWEMLFIGGFLLLLAVLAAYLGNGSLPDFLSQVSDAIWQTWGEGYADKSTMVVALALGIAISPSIYTLAEDAIFEVPASLKQASFALGATRYQTLRNVVLVVALPGILSAFTLGFGRAFGETMIVLMVSGNTPVADWSPFTALRALTANLAIELPESEVGSAHYRILFLTALLLFAFTFVVNTVAEWFRSRLRRSVAHG